VNWHDAKASVARLTSGKALLIFHRGRREHVAYGAVAGRRIEALWNKTPRLRFTGIWCHKGSRVVTVIGRER
jgi:hypothetical protein